MVDPRQIATYEKSFQSQASFGMIRLGEPRVKCQVIKTK